MSCVIVSFLLANADKLCTKATWLFEGLLVTGKIINAVYLHHRHLHTNTLSISGLGMSGIRDHHLWYKFHETPLQK